MNNKFRQTFSNYNKSLAKEETEISGELGIYLNGNKLVEVSNRSGFVYVRLRNSLSEVIQAFNDQVSATYGLPVIVVRDGTRYRVKGRDAQRYSDWGSSTSFVPIHANQHSFNPDGGGGGDLVWVYGKQMMPMNAIPSGTAGADGVVVNSYQYKKTNGTILNIGLTGTQSMFAWKPTDNQAVMGIVYVDPNVGNPVFTFNTGTPFSASITGTEEVVPYYPTISNSSYLLIAGIRLVSGTTTIGWDNIYDLRQWMTPPGTGTPAGGAGGFDGYGVAVLNDGAYVVSGTAIDFVGDGVTVDVTASGTQARVYISGSSTDLSGYVTGSWDTLHNVFVSGSWDLLNGAFAPTGTVGGGGSQPWISAYNDGILVGSGTSFSFDGDISVFISGSVIHAGVTNTASSGQYRIFSWETAISGGWVFVSDGADSPMLLLANLE